MTAMRKNNSWRFLAKAVVSAAQTERQQNGTGSMPTGNGTKRWIIQCYFNDLHRRYISTAEIRAKSRDLLVSRAISVTMWLFIIMVDFFVYSNVLKSSNLVLDFLFGASYLFSEITVIIYASGAAAYGISVEIYLILPLVITKCILAAINCGMSHGKTVLNIIYVVKTVSLFLATELSFQNFKGFTFQQSYKLHYQAATRAILRQSIYLTVTIMFLVSPGLRAVYKSIRLQCLYRNQTKNGSYCNIIDMDQPIFAEDDPCENDYSSMVSSIEQLRIVRDIALCSIAFYSMYNRAFFDITGTGGIIHNILIILFVAMSCSFIIANIDPFLFNKIKLYFNIIEVIIFVITTLLLVFNLWKKNDRKKHTIMEDKPVILG